MFIILKIGHQPGVYVPLRALFLVLAGNKNIHKSFDEFGFWPDPTTDYRVSRP